MSKEIDIKADGTNGTNAGKRQCSQDRYQWRAYYHLKHLNQASVFNIACGHYDVQKTDRRQ